MSFITSRDLKVLLLVLGCSMAVYYGSSLQDEPLLASHWRDLQYQTSSTRTSTVNLQCSGLNRAQLVDSSQTATANQYKAALAAQFSINSTVLISDFLGGRSSAAITTVQGSASQFATFIGVFIVGLALTVILWPFLCCCCCCPSCCPSKCCQKNEDEQYTKCELYWPSIVLILLLLLIVGASAAGLSKASQVSSSSQSMSCAMAIIFDDLINGNVTTNGSTFFMGLSTLSNQLSVLKSNLGTISSQLNSISNTGAVMVTNRNLAVTALDRIAKIPNNANPGAYVTLTYDTPLDTGALTGTIPSTFPAVLGSVSTNDGLINGATQALNGVKTILDGIAQAATDFTSNVATFTTAVDNVITSINDFSTQISSYDHNFGTFLKYSSDYAPTITLAIQGFYGAILGLAVLSLIGVLLMTCCDQYKCRYLTYFVCFIFLILGILLFFLAELFSIMVPTFYFLCQFMDSSFSSSANFQANFGTIINNPQITSYITACLPTSNGDLISIIGPSIATSINGLKNSISGAANFNGTTEIGKISTGFSNIPTTIENYRIAAIVDITDSTALGVITNLAQPTNFACSSAGFSTDSWVMSNSQNPVYDACQSNLGVNAANTECAGANLDSTAGTCRGCLDTFSIFSSKTTAASVTTALNTRYGNANCATFKSAIGNVWFNFLKKKDTVIAPVHARAVTASNAVNSYTTDITNNIVPTFTSVFNTLNSSLNSIVDPKFGLIAGLNCQLFGEDIVRVIDTMCIPMFNTFYFTRLVLGIVAFAILFSLCCTVCAGVRHYKHSERKERILPGMGKGGLDSSNAKFM